MKNYFAVIWLAYFMATTANLVNSQRNLNYKSNFIVGSCCKEIEQQLAEIKEQIRAIKKKASGW